MNVEPFNYDATRAKLKIIQSEQRRLDALKVQQYTDILHGTIPSSFDNVGRWVLTYVTMKFAMDDKPLVRVIRDAGEFSMQGLLHHSGAAREHYEWVIVICEALAKNLNHDEPPEAP